MKPCWNKYFSKLPLAVLVTGAAILNQSCNVNGDVVVTNPASITVTSTTPTNNTNGVAISSKLIANFTVSNGGYSSHTLALTCGGNTLPTTSTVTSVNTSGITSYTLTLSPSNPLPYAQTCQLQGQITGTPSGGNNGTVSISFTTAPVPLQPKLVVGGDHVSVLDLQSGVEQSLAFKGLTCYGLAFNPVTRKVHISCQSGLELNAIYDPISNIISGVTPSSLPTTNTQVSPLVCATNGKCYSDSINAIFMPPTVTQVTPLVCATDGKCYYGLGIEATGTNTVSDGRIVIVQNGSVISTLNLAGRSKNLIPTHLAISGDKLWVVEQRPPTHVPYTPKLGTLSRYNLTTLAPEWTVELNSMISSLAANSQQVAIGITTPPGGNSILLYNASGSSTVELASANISGSSICFTGGPLPFPLPPQPLCPDIRALAFNGDTLIAQTRNSINTYTLPNLGPSKSLTFDRSADSPASFHPYLQIGNGKLYSLEEQYNRISEYALDTMNKVREFNISGVVRARALLLVTEPK